MNGVVLAEHQDGGPGPEQLEQWAQSFLTLAQVSGEMARTAFVPNSLRVFRNNGTEYDSQATAAQVTAAILTGRELGLEPMAALRSIHVINATPALSALALRAIVLAAGHRIWVEEATNTRAAVAGVRAGDTHEQRVTWTLDDAKSRGLAGRPNWRSQPRNMLIARATAEVARLVAADAILGVPYVLEELEDDDTTAEIPAPPPPSDVKPLRRRRPPAPPAVARSNPPVQPAQGGDEPPLDDHPTPDQQQPAQVKPTDAQMRLLFHLFTEKGMPDRDSRLRWVNSQIEREIHTAADLTDIEASRLIEQLQQLPPADQGAAEQQILDADPGPEQ